MQFYIYYNKYLLYIFWFFFYQSVLWSWLACDEIFLKSFTPGQVEALDIRNEGMKDDGEEERGYRNGWVRIKAAPC